VIRYNNIAETTRETAMDEQQKKSTTRHLTKEQREKIEKRAMQMLERVRDAERLEAKKKRADDTTRKILLGATVMNAMDTGKLDRRNITALLDAFLDKDRDRKLFDLPVRPGKLPAPAAAPRPGGFHVEPDTEDI
jgi:hypothetical protein